MCNSRTAGEFDAAPQFWGAAEELHVQIAEVAKAAV